MSESLDAAECSSDNVRKYLVEAYDVPAHRINEAVDRHAFRITEGRKFRRTAGDVGDDIAGVEKWSLKP